MSLKKPRQTYKPFEYPVAFEYTKKQQRAHWLPSEVSLEQDIHDFKHTLTESERKLISRILKTFAQTEVFVEDYWAKVPTLFPKPEIAAMCYTFAAMEAIHAEGYFLLNESLDIKTLDSLINDENYAKKVEMFEYETSTLSPYSLAVFSAFTEGVMLYSSFIALMSFQLQNKMKGVAQIVEWSVRDESLHSAAGCWLFREYLTENPNFKEVIQKNLFNTADIVRELEHEAVDILFKDIETSLVVTPDQIKNFIDYRIGAKILELGFDTVPQQYKKPYPKELDWFSTLISGQTHTDFFAAKVTDYSKTDSSWNDLF